MKAGAAPNGRVTASSALRISRAIAIILAGLVLAWLVLRQLGLALLLPAQPAAAMGLWPASSAAMALLARDRVVAAGGDVDAPTRALAIRALRQEPASGPPLVLLGFSASAGGDLVRARGLIEAGRDRNPRNAIARFWLLDHYMRTGQFAAGLDELGPAIRLRGTAQGQIVGVAVALLQVPTARPALRAALAKDPFWRSGFFAAAATTLPDLRPLAAMLTALPPPRDAEAAEVEQRQVWLNMVARQQVAEAYAGWTATLPARQRAQPSKPVYDPTFADLAGAVPFNWTLTNSDTTTATLTEPSGVTLFAGGDAPQVLTEQLVPVTPGAYRLAVLASRPDDDIGGLRYEARVICARGDTVVGTVALTPSGAPAEPFTGTVGIPPSCTAIRLQIVATPGEGTSGPRLHVSAVRLSKL